MHQQKHFFQECVSCFFKVYGQEKLTVWKSKLLKDLNKTKRTKCLHGHKVITTGHTFWTDSEKKKEKNGEKNDTLSPSCPLPTKQGLLSFTWSCVTGVSGEQALQTYQPTRLQQTTNCHSPSLGLDQKWHKKKERKPHEHIHTPKPFTNHENKSIKGERLRMSNNYLVLTENI